MRARALLHYYVLSWFFRKGLDNQVNVVCFVYTEHGGNIITGIFHSRILLFVNNALIKYFRKHQNTVESITFRSELISLWIAREMILDIIIKLKMFVVPLAGPENVFGDNNQIVKRTNIS